MYLAVKRQNSPIGFKAPPCPIERDIRNFLAGKNDGEDLLHDIYDHVLDEPIPERLLALLRR